MIPFRLFGLAIVLHIVGISGFAQGHIISDNRRFGFVSYTGDTLLPLEYHYISRSFPVDSSSYLYLVRDSLVGVADTSGKIYYEPQFEWMDASIFSERILVERGGKMEVLDLEGHPSPLPELTGAFELMPYHYLRIVDDKEDSHFWNLDDGKWEIPPFVEDFGEGGKEAWAGALSEEIRVVGIYRYAIRKRNFRELEEFYGPQFYQWGEWPVFQYRFWIVDACGTPLAALPEGFRPKKLEATFQNGLLIVEGNSPGSLMAQPLLAPVFGVVDRQGEWVIPPIFASIDDFSESLAYACLAPDPPTEDGVEMDFEADPESPSGCGYIDARGSFHVVIPQGFFQTHYGCMLQFGPMFDGMALIRSQIPCRDSEVPCPDLCYVTREGQIQIGSWGKCNESAGFH